MRWIALLFSVACGVVIVGLVSLYGFRSADSPEYGYISAFLFGGVTMGALYSHAFAVRVWRRNKIGGAIIGLIGTAAVIMSLSNSLGALAARNDRTQAERAKVLSQVKDDRAELARVEAQREAMPPFQYADEATVAASRAAVEAATNARRAECGNGDPRQRGPNCRARELDEKAAFDRLAEVTAAKAATDRAKALDDRISTLRKKIEEATAVKSVNPHGEAIAKLLMLSDTLADTLSTWQQFSMMIVLELMVISGAAGFEILRPERERRARRMDVSQSIPEAASTPAALMLDPEPIPELEPPRPRLVASEKVPFGNVASIMSSIMRPGEGKVELAEAYAAYAAACQTRRRRPVSVPQFAQAMQTWCRKTRIAIEADRESVHFMNVQLASPLTATTGKRG